MDGRGGRPTLGDLACARVRARRTRRAPAPAARPASRDPEARDRSTPRRASPRDPPPPPAPRPTIASRIASTTPSLVALPNLHENPHALAFKMRGAVDASEKRVLSIGKLGHGQEGYYLETVATGVEDYYVGRGEAPGRWLGTMAHRARSRRSGRRGDAARGPRGPRPVYRRTARRGPGIAGSRASTSRSAHRNPCRCSGDSATGRPAREVRAAHDASVDAALRLPGGRGVLVAAGHERDRGAAR